MWDTTRQIIDAKEKEIKELTYLSSSTIKAVRPSCGCTVYEVNGNKLTLSVKVGEVFFGESKIKRVHANVLTDDGWTTLRAEIMVHKYEGEEVTTNQ